MGTRQTATWLALFVLIANACSGSGLERARPHAGAQADTVCGAQSVIATLSESQDTNVCQFQLALGRTCDGTETLLDQGVTPLYGEALPEGAPLFRTTTPVPVLQIALAWGSPDVQLRQVIDFVPPPDSSPLQRFRHALRSPNGPPALA